MRYNRLKLNIISSLLMQLTIIVCGFILPRLILSSFGSKYNGIVSSVNQFLSCVTLLRAGIGGVTRAALYKPLAEKDYDRISGILKATESFMKRIALIFSILLLVFAAIYPVFVKESFGWFFSFSLVLVLGISTISQYYFGITYQMFLQADQKSYVYNILQIAGVICNTLIAVVLIKAGMDFRLVQLGSALVFGATPIILYFYVHKHYPLNKSIKADTSTISQRWDAFAQQVAAFITTNTDIMVLTVLSDLYQVSIYAVYNMVVNGVKQLITTCSGAVEAMLGDVIAHNDLRELQHHVEMYEWIIHTIATILILCTAILIVPFVMVYTSGVNDTDYRQPLFAYLLCAATLVTCIRMPYQNVVEASGHFKQTRNGALVEAGLNLGTSILLVHSMGCVGVAIGTIVSVGFRTIQYAMYASKYIIKRNINIFIKRMGVTFIAVSIVCVINYIVNYTGSITTYYQWIAYAIVVVVAVSIVVFCVNYFCYTQISRQMILIFVKRIKKVEIRD